jgi:hypothetical protein
LEPADLDPGDLAAALTDFAVGDDEAFDRMGLGDEVALVLHDEVLETVAADKLRDRSRWALDVEGYAGFEGPFSAVETLARADGNGWANAVSLGPQPHCAGPPLDPPPGFEAHDRITMQPAEGFIDSCIAWYAVVLFRHPDYGTVDAVALELFGP